MNTDDPFAALSNAVADQLEQPYEDATPGDATTESTDDDSRKPLNSDDGEETTSLANREAETIIEDAEDFSAEDFDEEYDPFAEDDPFQADSDSEDDNELSEEEDDDDSELSEEEDDDNETTSEIDLEAAFAEIDQMKGSKLSKFTKKQKAEIISLKQREEVLEKQLQDVKDANKSRVEELEQEVKKISTTRPNADINNSEAFKKVVEEWKTSVEDTKLSLASSDSIENFDKHHSQLRNEFVAANNLNGEARKIALQKLDDNLDEMFEDDAGDVKSWMRQALKIDRRAHKIRQDFEENYVVESLKQAKTSYDSDVEHSRNAIEAAFSDKHAVDDLATRGYIFNILQDNDDARERFEKDMPLVLQVINGVTPYDEQDAAAKGLDVNDYYKQWSDQKQRIEKIQKNTLPVLAMEGYMMRLLMPQLRQEFKSMSDGNSPKKSPKKKTARRRTSTLSKNKKPMSYDDETDELTKSVSNGLRDMLS